MIDLNFRIISQGDELLADPRYRSVVDGSESQRFLLIEEVGLLLPFTDDSDFAALENTVNAWLVLPSLVTRGMAFSAREVIRKLKKLGFREKSTEGSHVHFVTEERKGKVIVPVHGGEIRKGTLKSILNQTEIDMNVFVIA